MEVIQRLEAGLGVEKNIEKAASWREKLPEGWQTSSDASFFKHLHEINYTFKSSGYPNSGS